MFFANFAVKGFAFPTRDMRVAYFRRTTLGRCLKSLTCGAREVGERKVINSPVNLELLRLNDAWFAFAILICIQQVDES